MKCTAAHGGEPDSSRCISSQTLAVTVSVTWRPQVQLAQMRGTDNSDVVSGCGRHGEQFTVRTKFLKSQCILNWAKKILRY